MHPDIDSVPEMVASSSECRRMRLAMAALTHPLLQQAAVWLVEGTEA